MATTSEWWCVEGAGDDGGRYQNQESANAAAQAAAEVSPGPVTVVQYQRTEVTRYDRSVTVTTTAL